MGWLRRGWLVLAGLPVAAGCTGGLGTPEELRPGGGGGGAGGLSGDSGGGGGGGPAEEIPPEPAAGEGIADPLSRSLHNMGCGGTDRQLVDGWVLLPHAAPEVSPEGEIERCVERYAGWVTNEADRAKVSRASVYAALAASGQCDEGGYDGALLPGALCARVNPELSEAACLAEMKASRAFGIRTVAEALALPESIEKHKGDPPRMAALLGEGRVACGGEDRWRLAAPAGYVDRFVAAYNARRAQGGALPSCAKRVVVTVALYTGMDDPGMEGIARANGCFTYERVSKSNAEWKICNYDGTVHHADGVKWAYDDTAGTHDATVEKNRILACAESVPGRGYVYMANRGGGWPKRVTDGVRVHFAEIYSSQFQVDDQFKLWEDWNEPGEPMINVGQPEFSATRIRDATARACKKVKDGGFLGIYIYPESLRGARMNAMVEALNACTGG